MTFTEEKLQLLERIGKIISNIGFPIVVTLILLFGLIPKQTEMTLELRDLKNSIILLLNKH